MVAAWAVPFTHWRSLQDPEVSPEALSVTLFNLSLYLGRRRDQWDSLLLLKGQVNELKFIDLTLVKPGLNLKRRMPGNEQETEPRRNAVEISNPLCIDRSVDSYIEMCTKSKPIK